jgi:hypothetical protein
MNRQARIGIYSNTLKWGSSALVEPAAAVCNAAHQAQTPIPFNGTIRQPLDFRRHAGKVETTLRTWHRSGSTITLTSDSSNRLAGRYAFYCLAGATRVVMRPVLDQQGSRRWYTGGRKTYSVGDTENTTSMGEWNFFLLQQHADYWVCWHR